MKITLAKYIVSAFNASQFPKDSLPEIAFAGRSNVGKSSLLNCLVGREIAKTSGTPGKTRAINFFLINGEFYFVDLPGYGYAQVSKQMRDDWQKLIEGYLVNRPPLRAVVVIIDARRDDIPESDLQMLEFLQTVNVPCIPVFTKMDKLSRSESGRVKKLYKEGILSGHHPVFFSAVTKEGLRELSGRIADLVK